MKVIKRKNLLTLKSGTDGLLQKTGIMVTILRRIVVIVGLILDELDTPPHPVLEKMQELLPNIGPNNIKSVILAHGNGTR